MSLQKNNLIPLETKIDHKTLHFLPFFPGRNRKKINITRKWGNWEMFFKKEQISLNTYDLTTLLFITREFMQGDYEDIGKIGETEIIKINVNVENIMKERNIDNVKKNRTYFLNSVDRLSDIKIFFRNEEIKKISMRRYLYDYDFDENVKEIIIKANKKFVELVAKGIPVDLKKIINVEGQKIKYKDYSILLYMFLLGTKTKSGKYLKWREKYDENLIYEALKIEKRELKEKRKIAKHTFINLEKYFNIPTYTIDRINKQYIRIDLSTKRLNKVH